MGWMVDVGKWKWMFGKVGPFCNDKVQFTKRRCNGVDRGH
jgi:hypothetical protein